MQKICRHRQIVKQNGKEVEVDYIKGKADDGARVIPLVPKAQEIIKKAIGKRKKGYIFVCESGRPLHYTQLRKTLQKMCKEACVAFHSIHKIRKFVVTQVVSTGADLEVLRKFFGWTNINTAQHYIKDFRANEQIAGAVSKAFEMLAFDNSHQTPTKECA
ncbi:MAG: tyrosine-type recombinase/integrase [Lachnospiraceae bacterium]|nr:tyrosine-type recombinase/integrase [Lachnospiraceae bacterium]